MLLPGTPAGSASSSAAPLDAGAACSWRSCRMPLRAAARRLQLLRFALLSARLKLE
jgi:hypothetical protein